MLKKLVEGGNGKQSVSWFDMEWMNVKSSFHFPLARYLYLFMKTRFDTATTIWARKEWNKTPSKAVGVEEARSEQNEFYNQMLRQTPGDEISGVLIVLLFN